MKRLDRRTFLVNLGRGTMAFAVLGIAACSDDGGTPTTGAPATTGAGTTPATDPPATTQAPATTQPPATTEAPATTTTALPVEAGVLSWERVDLGFVSAYVLVRDTQAAVVDTGVPGSAGDIEAALGRVGLAWPDVRHVIVTHLHGDHQGSLGDVLTNAPSAAGYAGEADIPEITSPRPLTAVGDGDEVFGLQIVHTPGHTPGHIAVFDPDASLLVAGDALNGGDAMGGAAGEVAAANPQFSPDMVAADASVQKLAALMPDTILFGHGTPVDGGAAALLSTLAAEL